MITIYHIDPDKFRGDTIALTDLYDLMSGLRDQSKLAAESFVIEGRYTKVAEVDTDDLESAYALTQNAVSSWSMEPDKRVKVIAPLHVLDGQTYGLKSSSVGDIFVNAIGNRFVVSNAGFRKLP